MKDYVDSIIERMAERGTVPAPSGDYVDSIVERIRFPAGNEPDPAFEGAHGALPPAFAPEAGRQPLPENILPVPTLRQEAAGRTSNRDIARMTGSTIGTIVGMVGGAATPPGVQPVTMPLLAGAGAAGGRQVADRIMDRFTGESETPPLVSGETALDFGAGAAGPIGTMVLRGMARMFTGLSMRETNRLTKAVSDFTAAPTPRNQAEMISVLDRAGVSGNRINNFIDDYFANRAGVSAVTPGTTERFIGQAAARQAQSGPSMASRGLLTGGIGALATGEPVIGGLLAAGVSEAVVRRVVPVFLDQPWFVNWAVRLPQVGGISRTLGLRRGIDAAGSLLALAERHGVRGPIQERALSELAAALSGNQLSSEGITIDPRPRPSGPPAPDRRLERRSERPNPFQNLLTEDFGRGPRLRDPITGQFAALN